MELFQRIKAECKAKNITLADLSEKTGIPAKAMWRWDKNIPSIDKVVRVAGVLGVSVDYLTGESVEKGWPQDDGLTDAQLKFALWGDTDVIDDADLEDVRRYAAFIKARKEQK